MTKAHAEVARWFDAALGSVGNVGAEVYPGYPGLVVANGELRSMVWGFPLVLKGKNGQPLKPGRSTTPAPISSTASCGALPFRSAAA